jgi:hypothetical protein
MPTPRPTLTKITAADGSTIAVTTRIDVDGCLRIDVFAEKDSKTAISTATVTAKGA